MNRDRYPGGDYRPRYVDQARGFKTVAGEDVPIGAVARVGNPTPPTPWAGSWQPTEGELVRWGGSVVLVPGKTPETQVLNATFPVPLLIAPTLHVRALPTPNAIAWATPVTAVLRFGVGQATTELVLTLTPAAPLAAVPFLGMRQVTVAFRWTGPAANEQNVEAFGSVVPIA